MDTATAQLLGDYTVRAIYHILHETPVPPIPEGITPAMLYAFAREQCVEAMLFRGMAEALAAADSQLFGAWQLRAIMQMTRSSAQLEERDFLIEALTKEKIPVMPVKGCWLKELYPDINDRYMGDMDILIPSAEEQHADALMLSLGYFREKENCLYHTGYEKPPYLSVELHKTLLPDSDPYYEYFTAVWDKALPDSENPYLYRLKNEDEYLYFIAHLNKHMEEGGIGLRMILDCYIYNHCLAMDETYLAAELEKLKLTELAKTVRELSDCWFADNTEAPESLKELITDIYTGTPYGTMEKLLQQRMGKLSGKGGRIGKLVRYILPRFFRPMDEMQARFPILKKLPFLIPIFWIVRIVQKMTSNERGFWQHLRQLFQTVKK